MRDNPRTTLISAVAGLVLLGGVVAFTVVVPELGDDTDAAATSADGADGSEPADLAPIVLPDELGSGFVAVDLGTLPADITGPDFDAQQVKDQQTSVAEGLEDRFGVPGAFRFYVSPADKIAATVVALDKAPGLFLGNALPFDPSLVGLARASSELVKMDDDAVCEVSWGQNGAVPAGQPIDPAQLPESVRCELGVGERTYELSAQGLTAAAAVELLRAIPTT